MENEKYLKNEQQIGHKSGDEKPFEREIVWKNVFLFLILHTGGFWGYWQLLTLQVTWQTVIWSEFYRISVVYIGHNMTRLCIIKTYALIVTSIPAFLVGFIGAEGIMVGNHRFFCHKCFKGNFWFKVLAMLAQTIAGQVRISFIKITSTDDCTDKFKV